MNREDAIVDVLLAYLEIDLETHVQDVINVNVYENLTNVVLVGLSNGS